MDLSRLRPVYEQEGPFATVYLEGRSPGEDSTHQMHLRWKALRERLASQEATSGALEALDAELGGTAGEEQTNGRVLVAADAGIVLDEPWDASLGAGDDAHWTVIPELGAYVREEARSVRILVVIADQEGAQVRQEVLAPQHVAREVGSEIVEGSEEGVHKPRGGALSHNQIQRRADEALGNNVDDIVAHLNTVSAGFRPRVLVLAGSVQARSAIRDALPGELSDILVETERGGRDSNASDEVLFERLREIASERSASSARERSEQLNAGLAHEQAAQGGEQVAKAVEFGAVGTLLFEPGREAAREDFLLKNCAETSAHFDVVEEGTELADGVGALLRHPLNQ